MIFYACIMVINKWLVKCSGPSGNIDNYSLLCFIVIVTCRSNDYALANFPINVLLNLKNIFICICSNIQHGPCARSFLTNHRELAFKTADTLISEHWLLWTEVISVHDKSEFLIIIIIFSTCNKLTTS